MTDVNKINTITYDEINRTYTNIITDYIRRGYIVNIPTMRGIQNEITKTDFVAPDKTFVRIIITKEIKTKTGAYADVVRITELKYNDRKTYTGKNTVWNDKADEINIIAEYYCINDAARYYEDSTKARFVETEEDAKAVKTIQFARRKNRGEYNDDEVRTINISVENKAKLIGRINTRWGYKRTTINDIEDVYKTTDTRGRVRYVVKIKNKDAVVFGR